MAAVTSRESRVNKDLTMVMRFFERDIRNVAKFHEAAQLIAPKDLAPRKTRVYVAAQSNTAKEMQALIRELESRGIDQARIESAFTRVGFSPYGKQTPLEIKTEMVAEMKTLLNRIEKLERARIWSQDQAKIRNRELANRPPVPTQEIGQEPAPEYRPGGRIPGR